MANVNFSSKSAILDLLEILNLDNPVDCKELLKVCERNLQAFEERKSSHGNAIAIADATKINASDSSPLWEYTQVSLSLCYDLGNVLDSSDLLNPLSVQEVKNVKNIFRNLIGIGISSNLLPNLSHHSKLPYDESICVFTRYKRLNATTHGIIVLSKFHSLKPILFPFYLKWVLSALYQIIFCPIKRPSDTADENGFIMTQDIYDTLVSNREVFRGMLEYLGQSVHAVSYIRETMMLIGHKQSPLWLKRAVSSTLTALVCKPKGVERVAWAMLDTVGVDDGDDSTKSWKVLEAVGKIVLETTKRSDFRVNISEQVCGLLDLKGSSGGFVRPFERLFTLCTSSLFHQNEQLCQETFIKHLLCPLTNLTTPTSDNLLPILSQRVRILQSLLTDENFTIPLVARRILHSVIHVIFRLYSVTCTSSDLKSLNDDIKSVMLRFIRDLNADEQFVLFDLLLFDFASEGYSKFRDDLELEVQEDYLRIRSSEFAVKFRTSYKAEALISIIKGNNRETTHLFAYFLNCLSSPDKYFDTSSVNTDLLHLESEATVNEVSDRKITVYKFLSSLAEDSDVQEYVNKDPAILIQYMRMVLLKSIEKGLHKKQNCESDDFQTLFLVVMLCQVLIDNTEAETISQYRTLVPQLEAIAKSNNTELGALVREVLTKLNVGQPKANRPKEMTPLDKAIEDICDPLLPVRGHGLMELARLIEAKDGSTLERKHYILNIFQQNLKDEDSFIYLAAINGLAAMADLFPDIVLTVLTDEFSECSRSDKDGHEVRIKIGEVLVRVVKRLGERAPLYKSLLLNTFLVGTKDEDHLVRASSLSNLGEVCRVLGYKLGTIVTEVLVCVHGVISTDKMIEPRRAAVTVIRQLFVGLEKETVVFLKDEILHVYRTLKEIYRNDADDVMRLQAQLALEQLNENVKEFLFLNPTLHYEKKIVILDAK
uniref:RNA polymerase II assembly factor Rtp1 C-terminal domain-containing protein n=1 Tax=Photinus pyralis TaxID=7054 RepID=A0A1Y1LB53_PHOPY